jgi:hypothetical protein
MSFYREQCLQISRGCRPPSGSFFEWGNTCSLVVRTFQQWSRQESEAHFLRSKTSDCCSGILANYTQMFR